MKLRIAIKPVAATAALLLLLCGCTSHSEEGMSLGKSFVKSWGAPDSLAVQVKQVRQALDGHTLDGGFSEAFVDAAKGSKDNAIVLAAKLLVGDADDEIDAAADYVFDSLLDEKLDYRQPLAMLQQFHAAANAIGMPEIGARLDSTLDARAAHLSLSKQMKVYSRATTPERLGAALKAEKAKPNADKKLIEKQAAELKEIYDKKDYATFLKAYQ